MKWTKERPTEPGDYRCRGISIAPPGSKIASVWADMRGDLCAYFPGSDFCFNLEDLDGEWSDSPIPIPEEDHSETLRDFIKQADILTETARKLLAKGGGK